MISRIVYCKGNPFKVLFDDADLIIFESRRWGINKGYLCHGATHSSFHRLLLNCPKNLQIHHIDHNKLNNCRSNLQIVTHRQNSTHRFKRIDNKSGFIGVSWHKRQEKWIAYIKLNNKFKHIGYFTDLVEAAKARDDLAKKYYGEFAMLNFK